MELCVCISTKEEERIQNKKLFLGGNSFCDCCPSDFFVPAEKLFSTRFWFLQSTHASLRQLLEFRVENLSVTFWRWSSSFNRTSTYGSYCTSQFYFFFDRAAADWFIEHVTFKDLFMQVFILIRVVRELETSSLVLVIIPVGLACNRHAIQSTKWGESFFFPLANARRRRDGESSIQINRSTTDRWTK